MDAGTPLKPPATRLPGARISLGLLLSINLLNYIDRYNLSAVEEHVRGALLKDNPNAKTLMGWLTTAFLITYMLAAPLFGWLADRTKRWTIIGIGVLLWSLATGACGLATSFSMLLICRVFIGVGEAAWGPTAPTIIADLYPVSRRGSVLAWFNVALPVGSALGFIIGGHMASTRWGWPSAFWVVAPPGLILATWALFRKDPPRGMADHAAEPPRPKSAPKSHLRDLLQLIRIRSLLFNTLGMAAMTFAIGGMSFWMVTYVLEFRMHGEVVTQEGRDVHAHINLIFGALCAGTGLAGTLVGGYLADWLRPRIKWWGGGGAYLVLSGVTMLLAFPFHLAMLYTPFPMAWVFLGIAMFLVFMNTGPTNTVIANVTPPAMRASAFALNILLIHTLGDAISPTVIGFISDHTRSAAHPDGNMTAGFLVVGAAMVLSGVLWVIGARWLREDTERAVAG
jgi:MFS family permease